MNLLKNKAALVIVSSVSLGAFEILIFANLCLVAASTATAATAEDCSNLVNLVVENTTITSATLIPAGDDLPEYCRVQGHVDTEIGFEVKLPTAWNLKLHFEGNNGFGGIIPDETNSNPIIVALTRGYATVATDTGHVGGFSDGTWALNNPERQTNFAHRSVHVVTISAKQIVQAYYQSPPWLSYFHGCSTGGRQALIAVQRYPSDFNGVIAESPVLDQTGAIINYNWRGQIANTTFVPPRKVSLLATAVLIDCDSEDGLQDGLISDPRRCQFNPTRLQCHAGDALDCLTAEQVQAINMIYSGPMTTSGAQLYTGTPQGHETWGPATGGWPTWITGMGVDPTSGFIFQEQFLRYFVFDPQYDTLTFNFDTDPPYLDSLAQLMNATDPNLTAFQSGGGKLLSRQGWADPDGPTGFRTIDYYDSVRNTLGSSTNQFFRLFMAPGAYHCSGGPGPNTVDMLTALENWVEQGIAPDRIIASHSTGGTVDRTRPLCPYPEEAQYTGQGSIDDADNFVCKHGLDQ
jgi:feruloyl esterase